MNESKIYELLIKELIKKKAKNSFDLSLIKRKISKTHKISCPSNITLLRVYHKLLKNKRIKKSKILENLLQKRPVRSLSGIVNVSVLTSSRPFKKGTGQALSCPGSCIFCPNKKGLPKSYLSGEPAVERAKTLKFDPYLQVKKRIEMLEDQGHLTDKIELRIIGGSFTFYPEKYKKWFLKRCFDGANLKVGKNLMAAQETNEESKHRIVGISVETRPNLINKKEIKKLRELGVTMVEMGVQSIFDDILEYSKTGLNAKKITKATKLLKDSGFKVMYQMMPNLPKSTSRKDRTVFEEIFQNPDFKPDWLKIYPCVVLENTKLYNLWQKGKYKSYPDKKLVSLIKYIKTICPYWVRIARIYRDIPKQKIVSGCKISNLRKVIKEEMEKEGMVCKCIRCREIRDRFNQKEKIYPVESRCRREPEGLFNRVNLFREDYLASDGKEIFLSFENKEREKLYSFLRLRILSEAFLPVLRRAAIIRELHTYGPPQPIGRDLVSTFSPQHRGLGKKLIKEAEKITKKEFGLNKIAVISGVGVRNYYRKLGYKLKDTYMIKNL